MKQHIGNVIHYCPSQIWYNAEESSVQIYMIWPGCLSSAWLLFSLLAFTRVYCCKQWSRKRYEMAAAIPIWNLVWRRHTNPMKFGQLILRNVIEIVATRCQILRLKCTKIDFGWGSAPDPTGGANSASPDRLAGIKGPYF